MDLIIAVAEDLFLFAIRELRAVIIPRKKETSSPVLFALPPQGEVAIEEEEKEEEVALPQTFRSTAEIFEDTSRPQKNTVMYIGSDTVSVFKRQTIEFDSVIARIPYGSMVIVLEVEGRWARIGYKDITGWMLRDELFDRSAHVYPNFTIGEENLSSDPNTLRVRACINDEFSADAAMLPLQSSEYVLYKLMRKGLTVAWPSVRPRTEGTWHTLLKGVHAVHIDIKPHTGAIMEYTLPHGAGHLAYVEAVFPDETISISESNYPENGIYNERVITKEEWRELHPVFLMIG